MPKAVKSTKKSRREQLVQAIVQIVAREGAEGLTFEKVGSAIGIPRAHVAYYFKDREAMLEAAITRVVEFGQECTLRRIESAKSQEDALCASVDGAMDWLEKHPKYVVVLSLFGALATYHPRFKQLNTQIREAGELRIVSLLESGAAEITRAEALNLARDIHGLLTGNIIGWASTRNKVSLVELRKRTRERTLQMIEKATAKA